MGIISFLKKDIPEEDLVTVSEAARLLNISPETLRRWEKEGVIKAYFVKSVKRYGGFDKGKRFNKKDIEKLVVVA